MPKFLIRALIIAAVLAGAAPARAQQSLNVLTGGTAGVYYPLGVALADIYTKAMPDARVQVHATKASVENLNLLQSGKGEVALTLGDSLSQAWSGNEDAGFRSPLKKLRGIAAMYPNYIHVVASAASGIRTLADLKGKRISVGAPKSGTELNTRAVLAAAGLTYNDFAKVEYLAFAESVELMKNRQIDVTLQSAGLGVASIRSLAGAIDIVVVPVPAEVVRRIGDPAYIAATIPADTYKGRGADTPTVAVQNFLVTHADVKPDAVYRMTKAMFERLDVLVTAHSAARAVKLEGALAGMPVPLHPGAERYYRDKGLIR